MPRLILSFWLMALQSHAHDGDFHTFWGMAILHTLFYAAIGMCVSFMALALVKCLWTTVKQMLSKQQMR